MFVITSQPGMSSGRRVAEQRNHTAFGRVMDNSTRATSRGHRAVPSWSLARAGEAAGQMFSVNGPVLPMADFFAADFRSAGPGHSTEPVLDTVEHHVLIAAYREHSLDHACASWSAQPYRPADVNATRLAAQRLLARGLIGIYLVQDGYPDAGPVELARIIDDDAFWCCDNPRSRDAGLNLTTAGEDLILALWDGGQSGTSTGHGS